MTVGSAEDGGSVAVGKNTEVALEVRGMHGFVSEYSLHMQGLTGKTHGSSVTVSVRSPMSSRVGDVPGM